MGLTESLMVSVWSTHLGAELGQDFLIQICLFVNPGFVPELQKRNEKLQTFEENL